MWDGHRSAASPTGARPRFHHVTLPARPGERGFVTLRTAGKVPCVQEVTPVPKRAWAGSSQGGARCDPPVLYLPPAFMENSSGPTAAGGYNRYSRCHKLPWTDFLKLSPRLRPSASPCSVFLKPRPALCSCLRSERSATFPLLPTGLSRSTQAPPLSRPRNPREKFAPAPSEGSGNPGSADGSGRAGPRGRV